MILVVSEKPSVAQSTPNSTPIQLQSTSAFSFAFREALSKSSLLTFEGSFTVNAILSSGFAPLAEIEESV